jgi:putative ABC transport system substrate-binding protein
VVIPSGAKKFWLNVLGMLLSVLTADAQCAGLVQIGALTEGWGPTPAMAALREELHVLGYREGEHFVIGVRFTHGDLKSLPEAARDLVRSNSTIIFASGPNAARAAQAATTTVPIVFAEDISDPVKLGLVRSYARPGGNVTGITDLAQELAPKRLEMFKELLPNLRRVVFPYDPTEGPAVEALRLSRDAARRLGITLIEKPLRTDGQARKAFAALPTTGADGIVLFGTLSLNIPGLILDMTPQHRLPSMFNAAFWAERGALASYGADYRESGRLAARLVDKIIRGKEPWAIPVELNARIELVVNLKVAKALGLSLAPGALRHATRVIE